MKCAIGMTSRDMIYIPTFIQTGLGTQKLLKGDSHTGHRQQGDLISLLLKGKAVPVLN
jgi:hypothetical protein